MKVSSELYRFNIHLYMGTLGFSYVFGTLFANYLSRSCQRDDFSIHRVYDLMKEHFSGASSGATS